MRARRWFPAAMLAALAAAACGGGAKPSADQAGTPATTPVPAANAPEIARPTDSSSSAHAPATPGAPTVRATPGTKANAAAPGELRDSVIKPKVLIDEKTGAVTPVTKKPR